MKVRIPAMIKNFVWRMKSSLFSIGTKIVEIIVNPARHKIIQCFFRFLIVSKKVLFLIMAKRKNRHCSPIKTSCRFVGKLPILNLMR